MSLSASGRRCRALIVKETLQIVRDPAALVIAFVLPAILLFLFAFAVSLDIRKVPLGVVLESDQTPAQSLAAAFAASRYFQVTPARDRRQVEGELVAGRLRGYVVIPQDFARHLASAGRSPLQIVTDGTQPNTANFIAAYAQGVLANWQAGQNPGRQRPIRLEPRFWFNPAVESRHYLVSGAIAIVMTMIGTLLTALVVAREWERGTMEAMLATPARIPELLLGKLLPYFGLGMLATLLSSCLAVYGFGVPLRGSWGALLGLSAVFLIPALGQGLMISALAKNQFIAAQLALISGFLPAFLLSGFLFEIDAMPLPIRLFTNIIPARHYVASLHTVFLAGDLWSVLLPRMGVMALIGMFFFAVARLNTRKSLDG